MTELQFLNTVRGAVLEVQNAFVDVLRQIDQETRDDPDVVRGAPHSTPVRRPDEVKAAREPVLRWRPPTGAV